MARTYSAVVTATGDNIAFQIEVSNIGTIVLERSINGTKWVVDREISEMFVFSNVAEFNVVGTVVGLSTNGNIYAQDGSVTPFGATIGTIRQNGFLRIGGNSANNTYTQMGLRQLLIFNKELSQAEVNDVLRVMFPA